MTDPVVPPAALARQATLRRLRNLVRRGWPPTGGRETGGGEAEDAFAPVDDELARLVYDSAADPAALEGLRASPSGVRRLTFQATGRTVDVEVTLSRPRRLLVHSTPARRLVLECRASGVEPVRLSDDSGTFFLAAVSPGPICLRCVDPEGREAPVATSWFVV